MKLFSKYMYHLYICNFKVIEEREVNFKLKKINREINSLKRKLSSLETRKVELLEIQNNLKA